MGSISEVAKGWGREGWTTGKETGNPGDRVMKMLYNLIVMVVIQL